MRIFYSCLSVILLISFASIEGMRKRVAEGTDSSHLGRTQRVKCPSLNKDYTFHSGATASVIYEIARPLLCGTGDITMHLSDHTDSYRIFHRKEQENVIIRITHTSGAQTLLFNQGLGYEVLLTEITGSKGTLKAAGLPGEVFVILKDIVGYIQGK